MYKFFALFLLTLSTLLHADEGSGYISWLYWRVSGDELEYCIEKQSVTAADVEYKQTVHSIHMKPSSGFRVGFTCPADCDRFNFDAHWTHFGAKKSNKTRLFPFVRANEATGFGLPSLLFAEGQVAQGESYVIQGSEKFEYNTLDMTVGSSLALDACSGILLSPYLGFRLVDIKERFHINAKYGTGVLLQGSTVVANQMHARNLFKGAGVVAGFDVQLPLCSSWSLVGGTSTALVFGNRDIKQHYLQRDHGGNAVDGKTRDRAHVDRPFTDLYVGVQWNSIFCSCYCVDFGLVWEHQFLFKQHRFWADTAWNSSTLASSGWKKCGNLSLQGLTLKAELLF